MSYADARAKKIARSWVYEWVLNTRGPRAGNMSVVALAGPHANDLGPIRALGICSDPSRVMLVDVNRHYLEIAERRWPGVLTHHGPLESVVVPWAIDVAVIDWFGHANSSTALASYRRLGKFLRPGSFVAITCLKGREGKGAVRRLAENSMWRRAGATFSDARKTEHAASIAEAFGVRHVALDCGRPIRQHETVMIDCGWIEYVGGADGHSPMLIELYRVARKHEYDRMIRRRTPYAVDENIGRASVTDVLEYADELERDGVDAAMALCVSPSTLAAWRAHRTRGTYSDVTPLSAVRPPINKVITAHMDARFY